MVGGDETVDGTTSLSSGLGWPANGWKPFPSRNIPKMFMGTFTCSLSRNWLRYLLSPLTLMRMTMMICPKGFVNWTVRTVVNMAIDANGASDAYSREELINMASFHGNFVMMNMEQNACHNSKPVSYEQIMLHVNGLRPHTIKSQI